MPCAALWTILWTKLAALPHKKCRRWDWNLGLWMSNSVQKHKWIRIDLEVVRWLCHQESRGHKSTNQTVRLHNLCQLVWEHGCLFGIRAGLRLCAFVCPHTCVYAHSCSQQLFKAFKAGRKKTTGVNVGIHSAHSLLIFYKSTWGQLFFTESLITYWVHLEIWLWIRDLLFSNNCASSAQRSPPNLVFIHELWVLNKSLTLCSIAVFFFLSFSWNALFDSFIEYVLASEFKTWVLV